MKFSINKRLFNNALSNVSKAISPNSPVPSLSGIKIELKDNNLILTAADSTLSIIKTIPITSENYNIMVESTGVIVLDARYLLEMVRKIDGDTITIDVLDTTLTRIKGNKVEYTVNGMRAEDYPEIRTPHPETSFEIDADELVKSISQTIFAVSKKETRPVLTGVNLVNKSGLLSMIATDSFRLSRKQLKIDTIVSFNVTIPARTLDIVDKIIEDNSTVTIYVGDMNLQFLIGDTIIQSRLIDGSFPETERLIPTTHSRRLVLNSMEILNALDRCSFIKNDGMALVKFSANASILNISSRNQEVGSSLDSLIPVSYEGDPIEISFCGDYAKEAIRALDDAQVNFLMDGEMKAFLITSDSDDTITQLILPVRSYN